MAITQEQIDALELSIYEAGLTGTTSVSVDGTSVSIESASTRLKFLKEWQASSVNSNATARPHFGVRFTKLVPPGCG